MRDSNEHVQDDSVRETPCNAHAHQGPSVFKRSASEQTFYHLQKMEKNYSKLGNRCSQIKENVNNNGIVKVASLNCIHFIDNGDLNLEPDHFVGRRDVSNPTTISEKRIVSSRGSIRGFKNRVRAGIATFIEQNGFSVSIELYNIFFFISHSLCIYILYLYVTSLIKKDDISRNDV